MKKIFFSLLLLGVFCAPAHAALTVMLGSGLADPNDSSNTMTNVIGLSGLQVGAGSSMKFYDVVLEYVLVENASNPSTFGEDIFLGDSTGALQAAQAMAAEISKVTALTSEVNDPENCDVFSCARKFYIPSSYPRVAGENTLDGAIAANSLIGQTGAWQGIGGTADGTDTVVIARFKEVAAPVPVPPAVFLFGSGVIALIGVSRRRRRIFQRN